MKHFLYVIIALFYFSAEGQQTDYVDFTDLRAIIDINVEAKTISGSVNYNFDILKETDSIYIDAKNIKLKHLLVSNYDSVKVSNDGKRIWIIDEFKPSIDNYMMLSYNVEPVKALYFNGWTEEGRNQVWTQGQGKYTSNWLPSFDDMNEKVRFDISIAFDKDYQVISNGKSNSQLSSNGRDIGYIFNMNKPMSSYLVALAIGKYNKKTETSKSGIPLEMYYYPEDSLKVEPTYRYTKQMFDFLEEEIGVPYPWQNYKQVPVKDFLYSGMENTSLTIFNDDFIIDETSFVDKNYVNVNAHELAHQWFGNLVTATESKHHWLQEGFATYYALLAERDIFGDDYYNWKLYEYLQELLSQDQAGNSTALLDPKASSATFYKKGAWVLHILREKVGDDNFKRAIVKYLEAYKFKNVKTEDFIGIVEQTSGQDLREFTKKWLISKELYYGEMEMQLASESSAIKGHLSIDCTAYSSKCGGYLTSWLADESKVKVIQQMPNKIKREDFKNSIKVRQAIAQNVVEIPSALKANYETLLDDKSYITIEAALYNLWSNFPKDRNKYLDKTKAVNGFNDKNVRTLWLVLALNTKDYNDNQKQKYYDELVDYTMPKYGFQLRQNAFSYLNSINALNEASLINLVDASKHHNWRFKSFARNLLKSLSKDEKYKEIIANLQAKQKQ